MKPFRSEPAKTILTICIGFLILFLVFHLKWAIWVALIIGLAGIFSDYLARQIERVWMKISYLLSLIVPNILLSVVYFFLLFPVALLSRFFGKKDPLILKNRLKSTFIYSNKTFNRESFEKPW